MVHGVWPRELYDCECTASNQLALSHLHAVTHPFGARRACYIAQLSRDPVNGQQDEDD